MSIESRVFPLSRLLNLESAPIYCCTAIIRLSSDLHVIEFPVGSEGQCNYALGRIVLDKEIFPCRQPHCADSPRNPKNDGQCTIANDAIIGRPYGFESIFVGWPPGENEIAAHLALEARWKSHPADDSKIVTYYR